MNKTMNLSYKKGTALPLGTTITKEGVNFAVSIPNTEECKLNIYLKGEEKPVLTIELDNDFKTGTIFAVFVKGIDIDSCEYMYEVMNCEFVDTYCKKLNGRDIWARPLGKKEKKFVRCGFVRDNYNWRQDVKLNTPYSESVMYKTHVRGFTMNENSKVPENKRGTFAGITTKIPYLKKLGITSLIIMPAYDFDEILIDKYMMGPENPTYVEYKDLVEKKDVETDDPVTEHYIRNKILQGVIPYRVNYWGYSESASYFAPKSSYASEPDNVVNEFKDMVLKLHKAGIELIMEFNFDYWTSNQLIIDVLRYWIMEYHVDGFLLNNNGVPLSTIATDSVISGSKLLALNWNLNEIYKDEYKPYNKNLAEFNDGFMVDVRRFIKGDEGQINNIAYRLRRNEEKFAIINYVANYNGFTMNDVFSYDLKHNDDNGEANRDGTEFNFSWNCGIEGPTKKVKIIKLRKKMLKNLLVALMFSQGTPMLLAGDELCNTQNGNNNAYCQDNETTWIDWSMNSFNRDIQNFTKELIKIRKEHPILRLNETLKIRDYISCGYPDLSYHGIKAWFPDFSNYSRTLGMLLCGDYSVLDDSPVYRGKDGRKKIRKKDDYFYIAFNMHWEPHNYELPKLPDGYEWQVVIDTHTDKNYNGKVEKGNIYNVMDRSVVVFRSEKKTTDTDIRKDDTTITTESNAVFQSIRALQS